MLNRPYIQFLETPPTSLRYQAWVAEVRARFHQRLSRARVCSFSFLQRLKAVGPDQWFLMGFVLLLLTFLFVLLVQPSSVGRGGR